MFRFFFHHPFDDLWSQGEIWGHDRWPKVLLGSCFHRSFQLAWLLCLGCAAGSPLDACTQGSHHRPIIIPIGFCYVYWYDPIIIPIVVIIPWLALFYLVNITAKEDMNDRGECWGHRAGGSKMGQGSTTSKRNLPFPSVLWIISLAMCIPIRLQNYILLETWQSFWTFQEVFKRVTRR